VGGILKPGDDLDQVGFFGLSSPPSPLAFPTDEVILSELREGKIVMIPDSEGSLGP
jgi:hypothetical protein